MPTRFEIALAAFLGPSGTNIVLRLSAFLLLAMGVQIMWNGLHSVAAPLLGVDS